MDTITIPDTFQSTIDIESIERLENSVNGSPCWRITGLNERGREIQSKTQPDASIAYQMTGNERGKYVATYQSRGHNRAPEIIGLEISADAL